MSYQRITHSRSQRFGGHTKHTFYCSCGRQVSGNGGKQHFKVEGHRRITWQQWFAAFGASADRPEGALTEPGSRTSGALCEETKELAPQPVPPGSVSASADRQAG